MTQLVTKYVANPVDILPGNSQARTSRGPYPAHLHAFRESDIQASVRLGRYNPQEQEAWRLSVQSDLANS